MDRRDFIKNSLLFTTGAVLLSGCTFTNKEVSTGLKPGSGITTAKFKGLDVSMLGYGCMRMPMKSNEEIDEELNKKMVERAMQAGVNYYDTAYMYMGGKSEEITGRAVKPYDRASFNLTTKMPCLKKKKMLNVSLMSSLKGVRQNTLISILYTV